MLICETEINGNSQMSKVASGEFSITIFCGVKVTPVLSQELHSCSTWEQAKIEWQSSSDGLRDIALEKGRYIGFQFQNRAFTLEEVKSLEQKILVLIRKHCPSANLSHAKMHIIPRVLIG